MKKVVCFIIAVVGYLSSFVVPYFFPPTISVSASYDYGFNNKIGIIIIVVTSFIVSCISFKQAPSLKDNFFCVERRYDEGFKKVFLWLQIFEVLFCFVIWFCIGHTYGVSESGFFLPKLNDLFHGRKLYTEIDFPYGALLLYIPMVFYYIMPFLGLQGSYFLSFTAVNCLGFYLLYKILEKVNLDEKTKIWLLISIFFIAGRPISAGMNYTLFRFLPPFYFLYKINSNIDKNSILKNIFWLIISSCVVLNISPDIGIIYGITLFLSYSVFALFNVRQYMLYAIISLLILISMLWLGFIIGMFTEVKAFLSGSMNWPFVFSFPMLFFLIQIFILAYHVGIQLRDIQNNFTLLSLELMACGMIVCALGRCDPGHLFWNGIFLTIIFAYYGIKYISKKYVIFSILLFPMLTFPYSIIQIGKIYSYALMTHPVIANVFQTQTGKNLIFSMAKIAGVNEEKVRNRIQNPNWLIADELQNIKDVALPLSMISSNLYAYLVNSGKIHYLPYMDTSFYGSKSVIDRQLQCLIDEKPKYLIVFKEWEKSAKNVNYKEQIKSLFMAPYNFKVVNNGNLLYKDTVKYIQQNYDVIADINSVYSILRRKL